VSHIIQRFVAYIMFLYANFNANLCISSVETLRKVTCARLKFAANNLELLLFNISTVLLRLV
jgi:hypothetical protein